MEISNHFRFVEATSELQKVDLVNVSYPGRLTFWINIYNTLMLHTHVVMVTNIPWVLLINRDLQTIYTDEKPFLHTVNT